MFKVLFFLCACLIGLTINILIVPWVCFLIKFFFKNFENIEFNWLFQLIVRYYDWVGTYIERLDK